MSAHTQDRIARYQPDGAGAFEVRLKFRYTDYKERDDVKALGFRWDPPAKEWYLPGLQEEPARQSAQVWQERFDALDPTPAPYTGPRRRRTTHHDTAPTPAAVDAVEKLSALVAELRQRLVDAGKRTQALETERDALLREKAETELKRQQAGTYHATCPACGADNFFSLKEAARV